MKRLRRWLLLPALLTALPGATAFAAVAQSNSVTITGGYDKTVQTQQWGQTGTTQQAYTYQANVTTYQNEQVQTGTTTQTVQTGTKQVQTGTERVCQGGWAWGWAGPNHSVWTRTCVGPTVTQPLYSTVAVYSTQTVPVYTTEPVAVTQLETLTGYRSVPVYGWANVNTQEWVPLSIWGSVS